MNQPSSTITAAGAAGLVVTAFWAIYTWLHLGPDPTPEVVSLTTTVVSTLVGYFKPENVYPNGAPWREGSPRNPPEDTQ